ncbi:MAG: hypothetical protein V3U11_06190, partial [Planctomycetota bacterium]
MLSLGVWVGLAAVRGLVQSRLPAALERGTGCSVATDSLEFHYFPPRLTVTGLHLDCGKAGSARVARAQADLELLPLLRRNITLSHLVVVSPHLDFRDLPDRPARERSSSGGKARVRIQSFLLQDGRLRYEDVEGGFLIEATNIQADSALLFADWTLEAGVTSDDVRVTLDGTELPPATLEGTVRHQGKEPDIVSALAHFRELGQASASGSVHFGRGHGASPAYDLQLDVRASSMAVARLLSLPETALPDGEVEWSGNVSGAGPEWNLNGQAHSRQVEVVDLPVTAVELQSAASAGDIHLYSIRGGLLQGMLTGGVDFRRQGKAWRFATNGQLEQASMDDLLQRLVPGSVPPLGSLLSVEIDGGFPVGQAQAADGELALSLAVPAGASAGGLRPQGSMRASLSEQQLHDLSGRLEMPGAWLQMVGNAGLDGRLDLNGGLVVTSLELLAETLSPHFPVTQWLVDQRAAGSLRWTGQLAGNLLLPEANGGLTSGDLTLAGLPLGKLGGSLRLRGGRLYLDDLRLEGALASVRIRGDGALAADPDWQLQWSVVRLDLAKLADALAWPVELQGQIAAQGQAWFRPDDTGLEGTLQSRQITVADVLALEEVEAQITLDGRGVHVQQFVAHAQEGTVRASGSLQGETGGGLDVQFVDVPVNVIPGLDSLHGRLSLATSLRGTLSAPHAVEPVAFRLEDLSWEGAELMDLDGLLEVTDEKMSVQIDSTDGLLTGHADLHWDEARNSSGTLSLQPLQFSLASHPQAGDLVAHVGATRLQFAVPLRDLSRLTADLETQGVALVNADRRLENSEPVRLLARGDRLELPATTLRLGDLE